MKMTPAGWSEVDRSGWTGVDGGRSLKIASARGAGDT